MTTDFSSGSVPPTYRELFEVCSNEEDLIDKEVYNCLLLNSKLDNTQQSTILKIALPMNNNNNNQNNGLINRTTFYKTLALIAWAQQGKQLSENLFLNNSDKEFPIPDLGDLMTVKNLKQQQQLQKHKLGISYSLIVQMDSISVELDPKKKGLFLKYSEYIVSSKRFNSKVTRRYNDFVALQELLLSRFPYRLVPALPPKKIVSDANFLESRRRGLHRWLTLVCRHPTMCHDALVGFFLTDQGPDIQHRIRDIFRRAPDEFMTSDIAATAKNLLPPDSGQLATSREHIRSLVEVVGRLKILTKSSVERKLTEAKDSEELAAQLKTLSTLHIGQAEALVSNWSQMQKGFALMSRELLPLTLRLEQQADIEQISVRERLGLLYDILVAHRELCERLERGLAQDHQAALSKMLSLKKRKIQGVIRGSNTESVEQLERKMLAQENIITNIEMRSDFSLYCLYMETQLVYAYLETLSTILNSLIASKIKTNGEIQEIWKQVQFSVYSCFGGGKNSVNGAN